MSKLDWDKARRRRARQRARKRGANEQAQERTRKVHPNSMAARKWGRKEWRTSG